MRTYLLVVALAGCATTAQDDVGAQDDSVTCTRVEGSQLGAQVSVPVRALDQVREVTFIAWTAKQDGPGVVGFTLDQPAAFVVKADFNFFYETDAAWENPFGVRGSLAFPIDYIDICDVFPDDGASAAP